MTGNACDWVCAVRIRITSGNACDWMCEIKFEQLEPSFFSVENYCAMLPVADLSRPYKMCGSTRLMTDVICCQQSKSRKRCRRDKPSGALPDYKAPCTCGSWLPPSPRGPCPGFPGESALRSVAISAASAREPRVLQGLRDVMMFVLEKGGLQGERKVGFTKNTAMRHRRVGGRAVTVTAMLHRQRYRVIEKGKD